jgi:penicillin G amidase
LKRKWPWIVLIVIIVLLAAGAGLLMYVAQGGLPQTSGTIETDVASTVEIYRDEYGVPHIIATNIEDLFFANGYAQAQDRLWQMDMSRRGVGGKLSEILGEDMIETDTFTLTVGFNRAAQKSYQLLEPDTLRYMEAYSAGVNAYIEDNYNRLTPEFTLLGYKPEPWTPIDSLLIGVYMSWYLGGNMNDELFHSALIEQVGPELALELFPDYPDDGLVIVPTLPEERRVEEERVAKLIRLARLGELGGRTTYAPGLGSNNWVISGDLTPGQGAILANDMHLAMGLPSIWHTTHLILEDQFNMSGTMFPGAPGIVVGFNEHIAWGYTNTGPDVQDLYRLELNPTNPQQYLYMGEWVDAEIIIEEIRVKGEDEPRQLEVLETRFGPVISSVVDLDTPLSLRWVTLDGTRDFDAILSCMGARNWEEFITIQENFMMATQNIVYGDREGNIGYRANGLIPIRRSGSGLLPADGTTDEFEWIGYIPYDELPTLYNPPEGIIITANHRVVDDDYPYFISASWSPPYRAMGIWRELTGRDVLTLEDMIRAQTSLYNSQAEILGPVLIGALRAAELSEAEEAALELFEEWLKDPVEAADQVGASIYHSLYLHLLKLTVADEMGEELYEAFLKTRAVENVFDRMLLTGQSGWFNNIETAEQEGRDQIIAAAFGKAVAFLEEELGKDPAGWHWGKLHTITLKHNLGSVDLLARFFNRGPYPVGGGIYSPAVMAYQASDPYGVTVSAPWRYMIDLSDYSAFDSMAGGSSGHFRSKHYNDQTEMWLAGEYKEMIFEPEAVRALGEKLTLQPRQ